MPQNAQQRRDSRAAAHEQHRRRVRPVHELSQRAFDAQQRSGIVLVEQGRREFSAHDPPHVQFEQARVVRRRGDRKAASPAAGQQDVDVLAGLETK